MSYKFVRIRGIEEQGNPGTWYLVGDSLEVIKEHFNSYGKEYFKDGVDSYIAWLDRGMLGHIEHKFASLVQITCQLHQNKPWIIVATEIENEMLRNRINGFLKGENQYLGKNMAVLIDNPYIEITDEMIKDSLVYPDDEDEMAMENVRYTQWPGGYHWYCKVGKLDVVDKNGEQKWNSKEEAKEASEWFISQYKK